MHTSRLIQVVAESTTQRDRDELDRTTANMLAQFLQAQSVGLYHLFEEAGSVRVRRRVAVTCGEGELGAESIEEPAKLPALIEMPATWQDCVKNDRVVEGLAAGERLVTAFPLHAGPHVAGLLIVESLESLPVPHIDLIHGILRIVENHLALLEYGERDTLTGLLNRKTFESHFEKTRHRRSAADETAPGYEPSWLALADIDRFKSINDSHGHLFGDEVLILVSQLMKRNFRGADQLFRFGGEEFLIVLDHATAAGARVALERLRSSVESHVFPQIGRVTISLGYTKIASSDISTLCVERADNALYYAKSHGRNNVRNYEELVAAGELVDQVGSKDIELF
jgi:diguanylate cyclase (GGDEF)-like protein